MRLLPSETPLSFAGNRIGLLGGTFNPPHAGHIDLSLTALRRLQLDCVWWLVTPGNPLKQNDGLPSVSRRMSWCRTLVQDRRIVVTGFERHLSSAFTAKTLAHLLVQRPTTNFVWLMGGDALFNFHRWYRWQDIITALPVAVIDRPGWRLMAMSSKTAHAYSDKRVPETDAARLITMPAPAWTYLTTAQNSLSSTELRAQ